MEYKQNTNQDFQELIEKYLDGKIKIEEVKKLVNYYESFQEDHEWVEELGAENNLKNKILINILESIQSEEPKQPIPFYKKEIFKYVVAASVTLLVSLGFLFKQNAAPKEHISVVNTPIVIGTDKATLTLEDGTNIVLDKQTTYQSKKLTSQGKSLIYKQSEKPNKTLEYNYLTIPRGGQFFVELSDGTKAWLNSESKLKYPVSFIAGNPREIELVYGEVYLEVTKSYKHHGDSFILKTNEQNITVLGTAFNVKAYKDETDILTTLVEGSVSVSNGISKNVLKPGQQSKLSQTKNNFKIYNVDVEEYISWRNGEFSFTNKSLEEIMKVLSRWYDVEIVINNIEMKNIGFTGVISKKQSIEYILDIIKNTNNMTYKIEGKKIVIE
ncbi:FecR family protein [Cellulophaga sp. E16_2]|uniref:FecR family protein n=1 Tax=unclassified Cellulophaga TaxID=2634405 RepID=UPI0013FD2D9A|nr:MULTISPECIES: FecR family protein [unclassified Cellulophaga]MBO0592914.1 FecR family protein [Cellulophaga sp. E16_2]